MDKPLSATELRANIYRILDRIIQTGKPAEIQRKGYSFLIVPRGGRRFRLEDLPQRSALNCSPEELVDTSWENEWKP